MANKNPSCKFSKAPQNLDEKKSKGQVNLSIENNLIKTLRSRINETTLLQDVVNEVASRVKEGDIKDALKLIEIVKEPENNTTVNINQAVQVNKKNIDEAVNIINELR